MACSERNCDGMLCHLVDSSEWKKIDLLYSDFGKARNPLDLPLMK